MEADHELHTTANMVNIVPTGPVRDTRMDRADRATIGKMQYPSTLTTTVKSNFCLSIDKFQTWTL